MVIPPAYRSALMFWVALNIQGQMLKLTSKRPQPQIIWGADGKLAVIERAGTELKMGDPSSGRYWKVHLPSDLLGVSAFEGRVTCMRFDGQAFFCSRLGGDGEARSLPLEAELGSDVRGFPNALYETEQPGLYFGINVDTGFVKSNEASCCAWWRVRPDGHLVIENLIPVELDAPIYLPVRKDGQYLYARSNLAYQGVLPILDYPLRIPGAFVVVSWQAGILWVIRDGDPFPARTIKLASLDGDQLGGKQASAPLLLGIEPMPNGRLLAAERVAVTAGTRAPRSQAGPSSPESARPPEPVKIEWVEVDPMSGVVRPARPERSQPGEVPSELASPREAELFRFGFDLKGRVVLPWVSPSAETDSRIPGKPHQEIRESPRESPRPAR